MTVIYVGKNLKIGVNLKYIK